MSTVPASEASEALATIVHGLWSLLHSGFMTPFSQLQFHTSVLELSIVVVTSWVVLFCCGQYCTYTVPRSLTVLQLSKHSFKPSNDNDIFLPYNITVMPLLAFTLPASLYLFPNRHIGKTTQRSKREYPMGVISFDHPEKEDLK